MRAQSGSFDKEDVLFKLFLEFPILRDRFLQDPLFGRALLSNPDHLRQVAELLEMREEMAFVLKELKPFMTLLSKEGRRALHCELQEFLRQHPQFHLPVHDAAQELLETLSRELP